MKWQGYSHLHSKLSCLPFVPVLSNLNAVLTPDTWEDLNTLRNFKGYKRVENYIKTVYTQEQRYVKDRQLFSSEDIEAFEIERERKREQIEGFKTVERIIASRNAEANLDVQYDHCKSESRQMICNTPSLLTPLFPHQWNTCASGKVSCMQRRLGKITTPSQRLHRRR